MNLIETIDAARGILKDELDSARSFPDNSSGYFTDNEMITWNGWAQVEVQNILIQTHENWFVTSTSISYVSGQEEYSLPEGIIEIVRVEDITNTSAPIEIYPQSFNDKDGRPRSLSVFNSGVIGVQCYSIKGNSIIVRPVPTKSAASAARIYFSKIVDAVTSATSCSTIPNQYHELVMWGVVENGLIKREATAEAISSVMARRNRLIKQMLDTGDQRQVQRSRQVRRIK